MNVDDEHTARLLRGAVADAGTQWTDHTLPARLLTGVRRRRQRRTASGALLSAVLLASAAGGWATWSPQGRDTLLAGPSRSGAEQKERSPVFPLQAGAVMPDQAARAGLDGTPQCQSQAVRNAQRMPESASAPGPNVIAAYLTDTAGYEQWLEEFSGARRAAPSEDGPPFGPDVPSDNGSPSLTPYGPGVVALCWFEGDIPPDRSAVGGPQQPRFRLLTVQVTGTPGGMRLDATGDKPIPVLAPPRPDRSLLPADAARNSVIVHPQPDGVPVMDVLVEPPPPPRIDCFTDGCPDEQVDVSIDVRVNDEPFVPRDGAIVRAGQSASFQVTVRVEAGERLDDLQIGLRADGTVGGNAPLDIVLLEADGPVSGQQAFNASWDVPPGPSVHGLSIRWTTVPSRSEQRGSGEAGMGSITAR